MWQLCVVLICAFVAAGDGSHFGYQYAAPLKRMEIISKKYIPLQVSTLTTADSTMPKKSIASICGLPVIAEPTKVFLPPCVTYTLDLAKETMMLVELNTDNSVRMKAEEKKSITPSSVYLPPQNNTLKSITISGNELQMTEGTNIRIPLAEITNKKMLQELVSTKMNIPPTQQRNELKVSENKYLTSDTAKMPTHKLNSVYQNSAVEMDNLLKKPTATEEASERVFLKEMPLQKSLALQRMFKMHTENVVPLDMGIPPSNKSLMDINILESKYLPP